MAPLKQLHGAVQRLDHLVTFRHPEVSAGQKILLNIDQDQGIAVGQPEFIVLAHHILPGTDQQAGKPIRPLR
jgi:hypothetical protein